MIQVTINSLSVCTGGDFRLVPARTDVSDEGRLEYCYGNVWAVVCTGPRYHANNFNQFNDTAADIICKQIGLSYIGKPCMHACMCMCLYSNIKHILSM